MLVGVSNVFHYCSYFLPVHVQLPNLELPTSFYKFAGIIRGPKIKVDCMQQVDTLLLLREVKAP